MLMIWNIVYTEFKIMYKVSMTLHFVMNWYKLAEVFDYFNSTARSKAWTMVNIKLRAPKT